MEEYNIYQQIADRTQGDIYIGVVGRKTGKSALLKDLWAYLLFQI